MLPFGHIAASYLVADIGSKLFQIQLDQQSMLYIIASGNIADLDFITGIFNKKTGELHHQNITHTPVGLLCFYIIIFILIRPNVNLSILILISYLLHLLIDDLGYWLYKFKLNSINEHPQINWLYPFQKLRFNKELMINNYSVLIKYMTTPVFKLEIFTVFASLIYILKK